MGRISAEPDHFKQCEQRVYGVKVHRLLLALASSIILLAFFFVSSCVNKTSTPTEMGAKVSMLPHPEEFPQCIFLGDLRSVALVGVGNSYQQSLTKIKNMTAFKSGTHLDINFSETDDLATTIKGEAFRCPLTQEGLIRQDLANYPSS